VPPYDARSHLSSLVGQTLPTAGRSRPNRILEITDGEVLVATGKAPGGEVVPFPEVQAAGERLMREGELRIHPEAVGYRSAFIGAVLQTLPGVTVEERPLWLRYREPRFLLSGWAQRTWREYAEDGMQGGPLRHAASGEFRTRGLSASDVVYVVGQEDGQLILFGRLRVAAVLGQAEAERRLGRRVYEAPDHAVAESPFTPIRFDRVVPERTAREIETVDRAHLAFTSEGEYRLDPQALRSDRWLSPESAKLLEELLAGEVVEPEEVHAVEASVSGRRGRGSERLTPQARKAVELRAMAVTERWLKVEGFDVVDTSATRPYDFEATRQGERVFVEVKGTTGAGEQVTLTAGEVEHARSHPEESVLAVVADIELDARDASDPRAIGGELRVHRPWHPADEDLRALAYSYLVPEHEE